MCTKLIRPSKRKYGYKVVECVAPGVYQSPYYFYDWRKDDVCQALDGPARLKAGRTVEAGVFHCFSSLATARRYVEEQSARWGNRYHIIKLRLLGEVWEGRAEKFHRTFNGRPMLVSTQARWDGKSIPVLKKRKKSC